MDAPSKFIVCAPIAITVIPHSRPLLLLSYPLEIGELISHQLVAFLSSRGRPVGQPLKEQYQPERCRDDARRSAEPQTEAEEHPCRSVKAHGCNRPRLNGYLEKLTATWQHLVTEVLHRDLGRTRKERGG